MFLLYCLIQLKTKHISKTLRKPDNDKRITKTPSIVLKKATSYVLSFHYIKKIQMYIIKKCSIRTKFLLYMAKLFALAMFHARYVFLLLTVVFFPNGNIYTYGTRKRQQHP